MSAQALQGMPIARRMSRRATLAWLAGPQECVIGALVYFPSGHWLNAQAYHGTDRNAPFTVVATSWAYEHTRGTLPISEREAIRRGWGSITLLRSGVESFHTSRVFFLDETVLGGPREVLYRFPWTGWTRWLTRSPNLG